MANKNLCIFMLVATIVAQATWVQSKDYPVADKDALNWNQGYDYQAWADRNEFYPGDEIWFFYKRGEHSVARLPTQEAFDACCFDVKLWESSCGWNGLGIGTETLLLASEIGDDCKNGMKLKVVPKIPDGYLEGPYSKMKLQD